jgi:hypothetical protein
VLEAARPLNGDLYLLLSPLAELLEKPHPLAATVCLRAMINFTLRVARPKRYPHAARHLETCHRLAAAISDWGELDDHRGYMLQLRRDHDRKRGFWSEVPKQILAELEPEPEAKSKPEAKGLRTPGPASAEAGSVQPGLW